MNDTLLRHLYACPADPARWPALLGRLCDETGARSAAVQAFRFDGEQLRLRWQFTDPRTSAIARLASADNPRLTRSRTLRGLNRVVGDDDLFERGDPERAALRGRLATIGLGEFLGALLPLEDDGYVAVALHRAVEDRRGFDRAAVACLDTLAPHLRQAGELVGQLQQARNSLSQMQRHLDGLRCGLLVCDSDAQVHWMNRSARQLTTNSPLVVAGQRLRARQPGASAALWKDIACAGEAPAFICLGEGADAVHLAVRGLAPAEEDGEGSVLVALTRVRDAAAVPASTWSRVLGVTAAEAALVATLVGGGTIEEHAQRRGVSTGTVRYQLKQVLAKTGTHRQAELVCLALSSAAAHLLDSVTIG